MFFHFKQKCMCMKRQHTALIIKFYRPGEYWIMCGIVCCYKNVKTVQLYPGEVTALLSMNTVDKTHNAAKWLTLIHKDNVMLGVASDGILHFWQPPVVLTSHMDHSWTFHWHCLQQAPLRFHYTKTIITKIHFA